MIDIVGVKKALIARIGAAVTGAELGVQVAYAWPGKDTGRECVHGGRAEWEETTGGLGAGDDNVALVIEIHIVVNWPNAGVEETDVRAAEIGSVIAAALVEDDTLDDHPGVLVARVAGGDLDHGANDDGAASVLTQRITLSCYQA